MKKTSEDGFWECGVDWITASGLGGKQTQRMAEFGINLMRESRELGNQICPWGMAGFHGFKCGGVQMGQRNDECLIRLSSEWAWRYWRELYEKSDNVSRLDVQSTISDGRCAARRIAMHYREALRFANGKHNAGAVSLFQTNSGASTVYFNKRVSDRYGRVYDKGAESQMRHYVDAVRYELETKGEVAKRMAHTLSLSRDPDAEAARKALAFFSNRGLCVSQYFPAPAGANTTGQDFLPLTRSHPLASPTDRERKLNWLSKSVKASVQALIASGHGLELADALGVRLQFEDV
jgi:hypothetical protein